MQIIKELQIEKKMGDPDFVNKNCWLARTLNYPPSKRCRYCQSRFNHCLFFQYLTISVIMAVLLMGISFAVEGKITNLFILSIFALIVIYGYFFNKSTEKIIEANFLQSKAKDDLEELNINLQKKVDEQTKYLRKAYETEKTANEQLEAIDEEKNQFLLTVQHHLRTPLTSMLGYADLLLDGTFGKMPKKVKDVVKKFEASTAGLIKMVNDFLDVTQFQLGKGVISLKNSVNLCPIFKDIVKDLELEAKRKGIYLKVEEPERICFVKADETKLKAALMNIFDNAVKYTDKGGITISMKADNENVKIEIKDTGMGIPKEKLPKLFDITFERGESAKKNFSTGRGIGLYLSGQIIKAHNGRIWAESEGEGKGSAFNIILPIEFRPENVIAK